MLAIAVPSGLRGPAVIFVLTLAQISQVGGGAANQQQPLPVFRGGVSVVALDVIVTDRDGRPASGLVASDFEIFDKGRKQTIVAFDEVSKPVPSSPLGVPRGGVVPLTDVASNASLRPTGRAFVFVIDVAPVGVPLYERVLTKLFSLMSPDDLVAVVFPRRSDLSEDFTTDPARLGRALDRLREVADSPSWRVTRMALENAVEALEPIPRSRKVIVWVSGGFRIELVPETRTALENKEGLPLARARGEAIDAFEMFEKSRRAGTPIYAIDPVGLLEKPDESTEFLKTTSLATGGVSYVNRPFIVEAATELVTDNGHFYVLGFVPDPYEPNGRFRELDVRLRAHPTLRVRARAGYVPKPPPASVSTQSAALTRELAGGRAHNELGVSAFGAVVTGGRGNRAKVIVTASVRYPPSLVSGDSTSAATDDLSVVVMALDPDARVVASAQRRLRIPPAIWRGTQGEVVLNEVFELPRGPIVLRVGVGSETTGRTGTVSLSLDVPVHSATRPGLTHMVMGVPGQPSGAQFDHLIDLVPFQPSTTRRFRPSDKLRIFARAIGLSRNRPGAAPLVTVKTGGVVVKTVQASLMASPNGLAGHDIEATVPLDGLPPGTHVVTLVLTPANQKPLVQAVQIYVD